MERFLTPNTGSGFLALGRSRQGRLFRKQILHKGTLRHPATGEKIQIDDDFLKKLTDNFNASVADIVQVPLANDKNEHVEDPDRNIGEVIGLETDENGAYALIDVRSDEHAPKVGSTLLGASAMMHLDYEDSATGEKVGPTLLHVAVTNRPYVTDLAPFEEIIAATSDGDTDEETVMLTVDEDPVEEDPEEQGEHMDLEQIKQLLKDEHEIDLEALQAAEPQAPSEEAVAAAAKQILEEAGISLSNSESDDDPADALKVELTKRDTAIEVLQGQVESLLDQSTEAKVDGLVKAGRILPAQQEAMVKLAKQDPELFESLVPEKPLVKLSEDGVTTTEEPTTIPDFGGEDLDAEIARLTGAHADYFGKEG